MASREKDGHALNDLLASTLTLLNQFINSLRQSNTSELTTSIESAPNPLRIVGDSAKLIKAHTTKLSLLAINKPFTPSAISKVLRELTETCLPATMSAVQICEQEKTTWGTMMAVELRAKVRRVFKEMQTLLEEIRSIAAGNQSGARRDSLSSTGVVWESCDELIKLEVEGITGMAVQKAFQYRATIKDAIQELQDWREGADLAFEGRTDGLLDPEDEGVDGDKDSIEDMLHAANSMPNDRPELKALVEESEAKLKKIVILYQALDKRRIQTFKHISSNDGTTTTPVSRMDALMLHLKRIPHQVDELASMFYDLDEDGAKEVLSKCIAEAKAASHEMEANWDGREDQVSTWFRSWSAAVG